MTVLDRSAIIADAFGGQGAIVEEALSDWKGGDNVTLIIIGPIEDVETIAAGRGIHELARLRKVYGWARWRKRKVFALVQLGDGTICRAELHWYEAAGYGMKEFKVKRIVEEYR